MSQFTELILQSAYKVVIEFIFQFKSALQQRLEALGYIPFCFSMPLLFKVTINM